MKKLLGCLVVLVIIGLIAGGWAMGQYNSLVKSREGVNTAWAQVENVYQRRMDLIPNLVETVKGVANFEKETYIAVANARSQAGQVKITADVLEDPDAFRKLEATQGQLSSALSRLLAVAENYPELKANQNFLELQSQLEGTENRIAVERRRFNEVAQGYNTRLKTFPTNLIAGFFGFRERPYFSAAPGAEKAPEVKF
jgi:LemA protein